MIKLDNSKCDTGTEGPTVGVHKSLKVAGHVDKLVIKEYKIHGFTDEYKVANRLC